MRKSYVTFILLIIISTTLLTATASYANTGNNYGPGSSHNPPSSTPPTCSSGCGPTPPPAPSCGWVNGGAAPGQPGYVTYTEQCSSSCVQSGGSVSCNNPSSPGTGCVGVGLSSEGSTATVAFCPYSASSTNVAGYGFIGNMGSACISRWQVNYEGQTWSDTPSGCSSSITTPTTQFRQVCTNAPTVANVQFWVQLPNITPPSGYYSDPHINPTPPDTPWYPATSTSPASAGLTGVNTQDAPGATLGPYSEQITVPACPVYNGKNWATSYVMNKLNAGNDTGVGPGGCTVCAINPLVHGATVGNGLQLADDGSVHHYVFGWYLALPQGAPTVGIDPYLQWLGGSAVITNYPQTHNMFGLIQPTYGIHFSDATPGLSQSCPAQFYPGQPISHSWATDNAVSNWFLASQWQSWPTGSVWTAACDTPKIVVDFEVHIPTVDGDPMQMALGGYMRAAWYYNHFGLSLDANSSFVQGQTTIPVPPWEETTTTTNTITKSVTVCQTSGGGLTVISCTGKNGNFLEVVQTTTSVTTPLNNTTTFYFPAGITAPVIAMTGLVPGNVHVSSPFPVHATAHIAATYSHLILP